MPGLLTPLKKSNEVYTVPLVPVRGVVVFPHIEIALTFGRPKSVDAVETATKNNKLICLVSQKDSRITKPEPGDIYEIGSLVRITQLLPAKDMINALVKGVSRVKIEKIIQKDPYFLAEVRSLPETVEVNDQTKALTQFLKRSFRKAIGYGKSVDLVSVMRLMDEEIPINELADQIAFTLDISLREKQLLLETLSVKKRMEKIADYLANEVKILKLEQRITSKTKSQFDKSVREAMLRERKRVIEKELGEMGEGDEEVEDLKKKIKQAGMPAEIELKAKRELKKFSRLSPQHPERGYLQSYLELVTEMPWSKSSPNNASIAQAVKVLNEDHFGLKDVKERIVDYLAVMKLREEKKKILKAKKPVLVRDHSGSAILCFVGPPGVGKTSIGQSIARALNRKFVRISLGGIRDEAEIRGHRRTYVGAMPGRIIQGIKNAGSNNPVFMLDEIDKVGNDFRGDPSSALLEALDPEQNSEFSDHYLELPFDLSKVMFITTANVLHTIPPALRDRMEIIRFPGYTEDEKFNIAKNFLWKKQLEANGLDRSQVKMSAEVLREIISRYTREAGVRELERNLAKVCRKLARQKAEKKDLPDQIDRKSMVKFLGPQKFSPVLAETKNEVGIVTGLAYTETGGDILFIEVALMPGKGNLILTGKLGKVMKESAKAAFSYVRSRWQKLGLTKDFYQHHDLHIHVPEGAVPKDGPSAGIAITSALISALTNQPVDRKIGMTGEITLRGRVLEIGGIKEKVLAAHRAGLKTIILPKENKKDLQDIPAKVRKDIRFVFVEHMDEVLRVALEKIPLAA